VRGNGAGCFGGCARPFIGAGGTPGRWQQAAMALTPLMAGAELRKIFYDSES
jgi:hypothetical protein